MSTTALSLRAVQLGVAALAIATLAVAWQFGVFADVGEPAALARKIEATGGWGYLAFVLAYTALQPFGVPGSIFIVAAPLIWPWQIAYVLSMIGTMAASVVGFSFARFIARDWVSAHLPARLRKYDDALGRNAFQTVAVLRLIFWMPQALHYFFGVSRVKFSTHFWGSLVGYAPPLLAVSYLGPEMFDTSGNLQPAAWPIMGGLLVASLAIAVLARAYERRRLSDPTLPKHEFNVPCPKT